MTHLSLNNLRTRLAPTPSGYLHPGNGLSFLLTWLLARSQGGSILLRIDDLDQQRFRPAYLEDIFETLDWLGIDFDEGPSGPSDFLTHFSQKHRIDLYEDLLKQLTEKSTIYACTCTRKMRRERASDQEPCRGQSIPLSTPNAAWKVALPNPALVSFKEWGREPTVMDLCTGLKDFVVRKKDGLPAYQLTSLVDDLHWNINFVVRGEDLLWSTAAQTWIATQLSRPAFLETLFWHHSLVLDDDGQKLSKSKGAGSLKTWREAGLSPAKIYSWAGEYLGLPLEMTHTVSDLLTAFKQKNDET